MCGTLTVLGNCKFRPLKTPKPVPGPSSLDSKKSCNPKQMPRKGVPSLILVWRVSLTESSFDAAAVKLPTPGRAIASALARSLDVVPIVTVKPTLSNAVLRLRRFPTP